MPKIIVTTDDGHVVEALGTEWAKEFATTRHEDAQPIAFDLRFALHKAETLEEERDQAEKLAAAAFEVAR